jgi:protein TonB
VTLIAAPPPADVIEPPKRIREVKPRYPPVARTAQLEGDVDLKLTIAADGRIGEIVVERSANRLFNQAAIEAVRQWQYLPGRRNGVPIESTTTTTVRFDLEH